MPRQPADNNLKTISITVNRYLYDDVISRGYNISELFGGLLSALLDVDDAAQIRYDNMQKTLSQIRENARTAATAKRMQQQAEQNAAEQAAAEQERKYEGLKAAVEIILKNNLHKTRRGHNISYELQQAITLFEPLKNNSIQEFLMMNAEFYADKTGGAIFRSLKDKGLI